MSHRDVRKAGPRDERAHPVVHDAINRGYVISGETYTDIGSLPTHDVANQSRQLVKQAGEHLGVAVAAWVTDADGTPCYRSCKDPSAPHRVHFRVFTKNAARQKVAQDADGDPANLKYNPFWRGEPRLLDDDGRRIGS